MNTHEKLEKLKGIIKEMGSLVVAFSGGVDSSFLLKVASDVLGSRVCAATAVSYIYPSWEISEADEFARDLGVEHIKMFYDPMKEVPEFRYNPENRCYICKKSVFSKVVEYAETSGISYVADGTNADDIGDYRPGLRAVAELGVRSPLLEAGLKKSEIRELSREMGLSIYDKPAFACLATRIPYNEEIDSNKLEMIDKSELYIMSRGIRNVRVRSHGSLARIEVEKKDIKKFFDMDFIGDIDGKLREFGFKHVSLDLSGYRTGSMNVEVKNDQGRNS